MRTIPILDETRSAGYSTFKCGQCRYYTQDFRPSYGVPCDKRGISETKTAPDCFGPRLSSLASVPDFSFEQMALLASNLSTAQRSALAHLFLTADRCISFEFMQSVWFALGSPKYLSSWVSGYVVHAPRLRKQRLTPLEIAEGRIPRETEITVMAVSTAGRMATATLLASSVKTLDEFEVIKNECLRLGHIMAPKKAGKMRGETILDARDRAREEEAKRKAKKEGYDNDMGNNVNDYLGEDAYRSIEGGSISQSQTSRRAGRKPKNLGTGLIQHGDNVYINL